MFRVLPFSLFWTGRLQDSKMDVSRGMTILGRFYTMWTVREIHGFGGFDVQEPWVWNLGLKGCCSYCV